MRYERMFRFLVVARPDKLGIAANKRLARVREAVQDAGVEIKEAGRVTEARW
jgi:hypothetical protein